jgi:hypothetical protein
MAQTPCTRRRALLLLGIGGWTITAAQAAERPAAKKYSKERVGYRDEPYQGRSCGQCVLYAGHGECAIVEGEVKPEGWCIQWTPATMGQADPGIG